MFDKERSCLIKFLIGKQEDMQVYLGLNKISFVKM